MTLSFPFIFALVYPHAPSGSQVRIINATHTNKFSQELRLASNEGQRLEWQVGGFYTDENSNLLQDLKAYTAAESVLGEIIVFPNHYTLEEKALFGAATYHFTERFNAQVGGRYSMLDQTSQTSQVVSPAAAPVFGSSAVNPENRQSQNSFTWLITPQYQINDDLMAYTRFATGYRPGGSNPAFAPNPTYGTDRTTNYEIGAKGYMFDRRLTVDTSVYDIEWDKIQISAATPNNLSYIANAGKARLQGLEAAAEFDLGRGWRLNGNTALLNAKLLADFPQTVGANNLLAFKGDRLPGTARFTANLGLEKGFDVFADFRLTLGANLTHIGERASAFRSSVAPAAKQARFQIPGYEQVDLSARLTNKLWVVTAYVRNVGNSHGLVNADDSGGRVGVMTGFFIPPQVVGMTIARNF